MDKVVVADGEWAVLQDYKHEAPYGLMRRRSEAVPMLSKDVDPAVVAQRRPPARPSHTARPTVSPTPSPAARVT